MTKLTALGALAADDVAAGEPMSETKKRTVQARVLVGCAHGQPDDVVSLAADVAKQAEAAGQIDTNKAAVAYALSLKA